MNEESNDPKIIVDDDWKSQVEAEKEKLKTEMDAQPKDESDEFPPASFPMLLSTLVTQALAALGQVPNPETGKAEIHKPIARHYIDMLGILEEKTKGNLTDEEIEMLSGMVHQLRMVFVGTPDTMPESAPASEKPTSSTIELP